MVPVSNGRSFDPAPSSPHSSSMSEKTPAAPVALRGKWRFLWQTLQALTGWIVIALAVAGGYLLPHWLFEDHPPSHDEPTAEAATNDPTAPVTAVLTETKVREGGLRTEPAMVRTLQERIVVPASVGYDNSRFLAIHCPVEAVVEEVCVLPGQTVEQGAALLKLTSQNVGDARNQLTRCEADLAAATTALEWQREISGNLEKLFPVLAEEADPGSVWKTFADSRLGEYRPRLSQAVEELRLARANVATAGELDGVLSGRTRREREAALQQAIASFRGLTEQVGFDARKSLQQALAARDLAERQRQVAEQELASLLGPWAVADEAGKLNAIVIRAPFSGRIESLPPVVSERLAAGEELITIADTTQLSVSARVPENDWPRVIVEVGTELTFQRTADSPEQWTARVRFVGATVSPEDRALPLVAGFDNRAGQLKPGMFVRMELPVSPPREVLSVPPAAVLRQEQETFVFVETAPLNYQRRLVTLGMETPQGVEIVQGLKAGEPVVTEGAFYLKSEMLLEQEAE